jgi:hypothetical protein
MAPVSDQAARCVYFAAIDALCLIPDCTLDLRVELDGFVQALFLGKSLEVLQDLGSTGVEGAPVGVWTEAVCVYVRRDVASQLSYISMTSLSHIQK